MLVNGQGTDMMNAGAKRGEFVSLIAPILEPMASALD